MASSKVWGPHRARSAGQLGFSDARANTWYRESPGARIVYGNKTGDFAALGPIRMGVTFEPAKQVCAVMLVMISSAGHTLHSLPPPDGLSPCTWQVTVGLYHACALFKNGDVKCWGSNK